MEHESEDKSQDGNSHKESGSGKEERKRLTGKKKSSDDLTGKKKDGNNFSGGRVAALTVGGVVVGAMTAGIGLIAGMMVVGMGAAGGGGALALSRMGGDKEKEVFLACESYHDAELWVQAIETQLRALSDNVLGLPFLPDRHNLESRMHAPPPEVRIEEVEDWICSSRWRVWSVRDGVRLFEQDDRYNTKTIADNNAPPPCLRVNVGVSGSALDVFMAVMNLPPACRTGAVRSIRVVESINNYTDIVHIVLDPVFTYPTWTGSFVVLI